MSSQVTLYDLPSQQGTSWSLNPWKSKPFLLITYSINYNTYKMHPARMILNYKPIAYTTQWVEYPDLAPTLSSLFVYPYHSKHSFIESLSESAFAFESYLMELSTPKSPLLSSLSTSQFANDQSRDIPPNLSNRNSVRYSSPAIQHSDCTYEMDSWAIAHTIERLHPIPSLCLDDPVNVKVRDLVASVSDSLRPFVIPKVPVILNPRSANYFVETREGRFGKPLSRVLTEDATETCWEEARVLAIEVAKLLRVHASGPFFLGEKVSYADFILVAYLKFLERVDSEVYERFMRLDEGFKHIYEACRRWLEVDQ
jgi:glutathione S-transferase